MNYSNLYNNKCKFFEITNQKFQNFDANDKEVHSVSIADPLSTKITLLFMCVPKELACYSFAHKLAPLIFCKKKGRSNKSR